MDTRSRGVLPLSKCQSVKKKTKIMYLSVIWSHTIQINTNLTFIFDCLIITCLSSSLSNSTIGFLLWHTHKWCRNKMNMRSGFPVLQPGAWQEWKKLYKLVMFFFHILCYVDIILRTDYFRPIDTTKESQVQT